MELIHEAYETLVSIQNKANLREGHSSQTPPPPPPGLWPWGSDLSQDLVAAFFFMQVISAP